MNDGRWTQQITECYSRDEGTRHKGKRSTRGRGEVEWLAGNNWIATAKDRVAWRQLEETFILQ